MAAVVLLALPTAAEPKVEPTGALTDPAVPAAVRAALESNGVRVGRPDRPPCELWLRKSIPAEKNSAPGALHANLGVSAMIGAIRFLGATADFRGQAIGPGVYTLRYALAPGDGSHLGVSDYPDFLLVVPAGRDPDPDARFRFEELVDLSRRATGTRHPGVFALVQPSGAIFPSVHTDDAGHVVLQVRARSTSGADAPFALVVEGHAEQ